jgi:hypothetical protein
LLKRPNLFSRQHSTSEINQVRRSHAIEASVSDSLEIVMSINKKISTLAFACASLTAPSLVLAGGGPLGIDSRLNLDQQGIWKRSNQRALEGLVVGGVIAGALWEGSESRLGKTFWQSADSMLIGEAGYLVLNNTFRRQRPSQTDDPNQWFKSGGHSFPSGEVTTISSAITPFVLEYGPGTRKSMHWNCYRCTTLWRA